MRMVSEMPAVMTMMAMVSYDISFFESYCVTTVVVIRAVINLGQNY